MEKTMPKSKSRKKSNAMHSRSWKEARLTKSSALTPGTRLSGDILDALADLLLEAHCNAVVEGETFGTWMTGFDISGRSVGFVDGPHGSGCRVSGHNGLHTVITDGSVIDNLDVVAKLVRRLNLVALVSGGEVWVEDLEPGQVAQPLSRTESFGRREGIQVTVVAPSLEYSRSSLAPIVRTPFGRVASAEAAQHLYGEQLHLALADCFKDAGGSCWAA